MMDRLSSPAKIAASKTTNELKDIYVPCFKNIWMILFQGHFSKTMMEDWDNDDKNLLAWRAATGVCFDVLKFQSKVLR
jgi:ketol-acid reductoisomerase